MDIKDKLSIRVNIADRYYPLKIERNDEEKIRRAARMINDKVQQYKLRYKEKDAQDFLAMAALQFVTKVIEYEDVNDTAPVLSELQQLDAELATYLDNA